MSEMPKFPDNLKAFAAEIARLCAKHQIHTFGANVQPDYREWDSSVQLSWNSGRHQDSEDSIIISSNVSVRVDLPVPASIEGEQP
jgi:hypothetical protein